MNIGIDVDDTISNSFETIFADSQKFDIELGNSGEPKQYGKISDHNQIETLYSHWTNEQIELFWKKYFIKVLTVARPKDCVAEVLKNLKEEGNNIIIITSRYEELEGSTEIEDYTRKWLDKNGIVYDKLVLGANDKLKAAKENDIDLFIDDSIKHCRNAQSGNIRTILYTSICNQGVETLDLERAYSWVQIYDKYKKIVNKAVLV